MTKTEQSTPTGSPYFQIQIEEIGTKLLIDTGAEISVISDQLMRRLIEVNAKLPTLPVTELIKKISVRLTSLKKYIPSDFCRKPKGLDELLRWKATEYRQMAIYTGIVVLYSVISKKLYFNFYICLVL